jgi:hypothetical protein
MFKSLQKQPGLEGKFALSGSNERAPTNGSTPIIPALGGEEFLVEMEWDGTKVLAIFDTGSSDTWLIQSGFQCVDSAGKNQTQETCAFGPTFNGTFNGGTIPNQNFRIAYGDGEFVNGLMGYEDITIAGVTVPKQEAALGTYAYWNGDATSSGLIGFSYPLLTSAFPGNDPSQDRAPLNYNPFFTTAYKNNLVASMFSLAIERGPTAGGYLALGGLPPVDFEPEWATTPIQALSLVSETQLSFYTITVDSYSFGNLSTAPSQAIVDSGTTLLYAPGAVAAGLANSFTPPGKLIENQGAYFADCNATAPEFNVKIAGKDFKIQAADLIYQDVRDPASGMCLLGVQDGGEGPYILGDVFLQNVVAVFDVGAAQMRFAVHNY